MKKVKFTLARKWFVAMTLCLATIPLFAQEADDEEDEPTDIDFSWMVPNNEFKNDMNNWIVEVPHGGNHGICTSQEAGVADDCAEYWWNGAERLRGFDYYQTITGLVNGKYKVVASMWYNGNNRACGVYASTPANQVFTGCENLGVRDRKDYETAEIIVFDGTLRIGVKSTANLNGTWFGVDYVKLYKTGEASTTELNKAIANAALTAKMPATAINGTAEYPFAENYKYHSGEKYLTATERYAGDNTRFQAGDVLYYEMSGLEDGLYRVQLYAVANKARNLTNADKGDGIARLFANDTEKDITVYDQDGCVPAHYSHSIVAEVKDGTLRYGIKNIKAGGQWYLIKNISLQKLEECDCICFTSPGFAQICLANVNDNTIHNFEYSYDGEDWYDYTCAIVRDAGDRNKGTTPKDAISYINISYNQRVFFRAKGRNGFLSDGNDNYYKGTSNKQYARYQFYTSNGTSGDVYASGNVMSLIDPYCQMMEVPKTCFSNLFCGMTKLVSAPRLPATTLGEWCYECMFAGCSNLLNAPDIPAENYATGCMRYAFQGCNKLQYANVSFKNGGDHNNAIFNDRGVGCTKCHLWCYTVWSGTINENVEAHYKDAASNADWLCISNTGTTNATVKLNNGASFQIQYSYNGTKWFNTWSTSSLKDIGECNDCQGHCYFTENCGTCQGKQTVACSNVNCVNGKVDCSTCGGTAKKTCPTCNGNKTISCSICGGDGLINCTTCNHTGKVKCTATDTRVERGTTYTGTCKEGIIEGKSGSGIFTSTRYWQCTACGGTYDRPHTQKKNVNNPGSGQVDCSNCKGKTSVAGQLPCTNAQCTNGRIPCSNTNCNGGKVNCDNCVNGKVNCNTCGGDQLVLCGTCSGSGIKYIACTSCRGSGEAYTLSGITQGDGRYKVMESTPTTITLNTTTQNHVFFRTNQDNYTAPTFSSTNYMQFEMTGNVAASGNAMTLIKSDGNLTTVPAFAFYHLFDGCRWLQSAPLLPATTLGAHCYESMFQGCENLASSPVLPAEELAVACYRMMFYGCSNLKMITTNFREWDPTGTTDEDGIFTPSSTNATDHWVTGVYRDTECRFDNENLTDFIYDENHIPCDDEVQWYAGRTQYITFKATTGATSIILTKQGNPDEIKLVYKKSNSPRWTDYTIGETIDLDVNQTVSFRAGNMSTVNADGATYYYYIPGNNNNFSKNADNYYYFTFTGGNVEASGNVSSLFSYDCSNDQVPAYAFYRLFQNCNTLTQAPELPGSKFGTYCYAYMFYKCSGLTEAPELPAITLATYCYFHMFEGCSGLKKCPELPATTLFTSCYASMFKDCTSITKKPTLPATILAQNCYHSMFYGSNKLQEAPELPATTLKSGCYTQMFRGCTSLKVAPALKATTLQNNCYKLMFFNCNNLVVAPDLPASNLVSGCYEQMFSNCTKLRKIHVEFTDWGSGEEYTKNWVEKTEPGGNFFCPETLETEFGPNRIPVNDAKPENHWTVIKNPYICFMATTEEARTEVQLKNNGGISGVQLQYSKTGSEDDWSTVSFNTPISLKFGDVVLFRAKIEKVSRIVDCKYNGNEYWDPCNNGKIQVNGVDAECPTCLGKGTIEIQELNRSTNSTFSQSATNFYQFAINEDGFAEVSGDVSCLINAEYDRANTKYKITAIPNKYAFYGLFKDCKNMSGSVELPSTDLKDHCYQSIFDGCENLTSAPTLPATNVKAGCYEDMFKDCKSITTFTSVLPTATLANSCYKGMFRGCSSLKEIANDVLTGTNGLEGSCFASMFEGCSSLETAPTLTVPGGGLKDSCYMAMFKGCSSLTALPDLSASTIGRTITKSCFESMFEGCTNVKEAAIFAQHLEGGVYDLMKVAPSCFKNMYKDCTSLTKAPILNTWGITETYQSLAESCFEGMFEGCTSLTQAPILGHHNLAAKCFKRMFAGCTSLNVAPELPATVLHDSCYKEMFLGCTSLHYMDVSFSNPAYWKESDTEDDPSYTYHWVENVAPAGTFMCPADLLKKYDISHIPYGWTADDNGDYLCFFSYAGQPYLTIQKMNNPEDFTIKYSHDKNTWISISSKLALSQNKNLFQDGSGTYHTAVYIKASDRHVSQDDQNYYYFQCDKNYGVRGNAMSILDPSMEEKSVPKYAFFKLFDRATLLNDVSGLKLPATTVGDYAYANMFNGCTSLQSSQSTAPALPATKLGKYCYENLFAGWTALTEAPELPAKELVEGCYNGLFDGCSSLAKIKVGFEKWVDNATVDWVADVVDKGEFYCNANLLTNAIDCWGDANNCAAVYGGSKIPKDGDHGDAHKWVIILDVDINYDYNTDMITIGGGKTFRYMKVDPTSTDEITPEYLETNGTLYDNPFKPVWGHEIVGLDSISYCAASYLSTTIPVGLCRSIVRYVPIYAYPKYVGYCLAEDAAQLKDALYYAQKASSEKYPVRVFLPRGIYTLAAEDKNLIVSDYVSLIGEEIGEHGTIIQKDIAGAAPLMISGNKAYVQDITLKNNNASGYAFYSQGSGQTLHVSMGTGNKYQTKMGDKSEIIPTWTTGLASGEYAVIDSIIVNGGAFNVVSKADTFLLEMGEDYAITAFNSFYLTNGANSTFSVRAANTRGAFGPYANFANFKHVDAKDDDGNDLVSYTVTDGAGNPTSIKLNKYGYASFYYENADPDHRVRVIGASAFTAECIEKQVGGSVKLYHINDKDIVKQGQGVILFGQPNTIVEFYEDKTSDVSAFEDVFPNDLTGTVTKIENITDVNRYYGLAQNEFRRLSAGGYINPNKAFFDFGPSSGAATFRMSFGKWSDFDIMTPEHKEETGIKNLQYASKSDFSGSNITYNLLGQRTTNMKGLLVKNGKVILQK